MSIDILRAFAEARAGDDEIVPGITYKVARDLLAHIDELTAERDRLKEALDHASYDLDPEDKAVIWQILHPTQEAQDD